MIDVFVLSETVLDVTVKVPVRVPPAVPPKHFRVMSD